MDLNGLRRLAGERGVTVIEDCAQSAGAEREGRPTGSAGIASGTSFYPTKNLGALGDGGALLTADPEIAEMARSLRDYGQRSRYEHVHVGLNSRLDELHAGVLRSALLPRLDGYLKRRRQVATRYADALQGSALRPVEAGGGRSAHHLFAVEVVEGDPAAVAESMQRAGIGVGRHYPVLCPDQLAARGLGVSVGPLERARRLAERELSLPIHPYLHDSEMEAVIGACLEAVK